MIRGVLQFPPNCPHLLLYLLDLLVSAGYGLGFAGSQFQYGPLLRLTMVCTVQYDDGMMDDFSCSLSHIHTVHLSSDLPFC